jgi:hypothetical protein
MIKNFDEFWNKIEEAFDNPVDINWHEKENELGGAFVVNDDAYLIRCINRGDDVWTYKFYYFDKEKKKLSPDLINTTEKQINKFRVLPTVKVGLEYLINSKNPKAVVYGALDSSEGRKRLYDEFSKEFSKKYNFLYETKNMKNKQVFILYKEVLNKEILFSKIVEISNELFGLN